MRARRALWALALLAAASTAACTEDEPGGVEASIARADLDANPSLPDDPAQLDVTVDLQARGQPVEVRLRAVSIFELPLSDGGDELAFTAELVSTQGDEAVVRLAAGEAGVARVLNAGTTNAAVEPWCRRPARLVVTLVTDADEEAEASQDITVRCP